MQEAGMFIGNKHAIDLMQVLAALPVRYWKSHRVNWRFLDIGGLKN